MTSEISPRTRNHLESRRKYEKPQNAYKPKDKPKAVRAFGIYRRLLPSEEKRVKDMFTPSAEGSRSYLGIIGYENPQIHISPELAVTYFAASTMFQKINSNAAKERMFAKSFDLGSKLAIIQGELPQTELEVRVSRFEWSGKSRKIIGMLGGEALLILNEEADCIKKTLEDIGLPKIDVNPNHLTIAVSAQSITTAQGKQVAEYFNDQLPADGDDTGNIKLGRAFAGFRYTQPVLIDTYTDLSR